MRTRHDIRQEAEDRIVGAYNSQRGLLYSPTSAIFRTSIELHVHSEIVLNVVRRYEAFKGKKKPQNVKCVAYRASA